MEHKLLIVVDMQNDFVDGALGTKEAKAIVSHVVDKVSSFEGTVLFTQDTHQKDYLHTQEGRNLPVPHCIKDTPGWDLIPPLKIWQEERGAKVFEKYTFGSWELGVYLKELHATNPITSIEFVGICTDICVVSNALLVKAALPEVPILVDSRGAAGVTPDTHKAALETMRSCQITVLD